MEKIIQNKCIGLVLAIIFGHSPLFSQLSELRVMTWNIRLDVSSDGLDRWDNRREALVGEVLHRKPHIVGFQEALPQQVAFLDENLSGYQRYGVGREDGDQEGEYSPIYYDTTVFELFYARTLWLSPTPHLPEKGWDAACKRIMTLTDLVSRENRAHYTIVNTHWDHVGDTARMESAKMILDYLFKVGYQANVDKSTYILLIGDLNAVPTSAPVRHIAQKLTDSCPRNKNQQGTFNGFKLKKKYDQRIDYIWYQLDGYKCVRYESPQPKVKGRHVSDHFPVIAHFKRKK